MKVAMLNAHALGHQGGRSIQPAKMEPVKRPCVSHAGTTEDWVYFLSRWQDYVRATKAAGTDRTTQLLECCDVQLRRDLTRNAGGSLSERSEVDILAAIRVLAVREENKTVARETLRAMKQDRDEPIRAFGARLRGQASICRYTKLCLCGLTVNYSEETVADSLCTGMADMDIQGELLGAANQDMSALKFIETKESGKRSHSRLTTPGSADGISSSFKKLARAPAATPTRPPGGPTGDPKQCGFCGGKGHSRTNTGTTRRSECPAFGGKCNNCGKPNHWATVCRGPKQASAIFDSICTLATGDHRAPTLDHHKWNQAGMKWYRGNSRLQPIVKIQLETTEEDYEDLGLELRDPQRWTRYQTLGAKAPWQGQASSAN